MNEARIEEMFKRYVGIISEDFQHKLNIVIEGQQLLGEKLDRTAAEIRGDIDKLDRRLTTVEVKLSAVEVKLDAVEVRLNAVEVKLDAVEVKLNAVEVKLDAVEVKLDAVAEDLAAHRADTEAHHGLYLVKEE